MIDLVCANSLTGLVDSDLSLFIVDTVDEDGAPQPGGQTERPQVEHLSLGDHSASLHNWPQFSQHWNTTSKKI